MSEFAPRTAWRQRQIKLAKCPTTLALQENPEVVSVTNRILLRAGSWSMSLAMNLRRLKGIPGIGLRKFAKEPNPDDRLLRVVRVISEDGLRESGSPGLP